MGGLTSRLALVLLAAPLVAGCGSQPTLSASQFIDQINAEGVSIELGRKLTTSGGADEVYAVRLPPLPGEPKPLPGSESGPGASGSLYVFGDNDSAEDQLKACQAATGLVCYRAANIAVVLDEESGRIEARRLGVAITRLAH
jgi:hypothetical protein